MKARFILPLVFVATMPASESRLATGANQFAIAAYRELARSDGDFVCSPFSISTALSMALAGARGQTAAEMARVLAQPYPDPRYHAELASLIARLAQAANVGGNEFRAANGLWVQHGFRIQADLRQILENDYRAPLAELDFFADPDRARAEINRWTAERTRGRIQDLFGPGSLDANTRLMLTSAVYFYGKWQHAFDPAGTRPAPFSTSNGSSTEANFMNQTARFGYTVTPAAQILEMPYSGTGIACDVLLPKAKDGLAGLESALTARTLESWLGKLEDRTVQAAIPKFRADYERSLRDLLSRMGMPSAFSAAADFSGIDDRRDLALSDVRHKAFVEFSEKGTEAAAATGAAVSLIAMRPEQRPLFRADHPFAFFIRDTRTGLILFAGRVAQPR